MKFHTTIRIYGITHTLKKKKKIKQKKKINKKKNNKTNKGYSVQGFMRWRQQGRLEQIQR